MRDYPNETTVTNPVIVVWQDGVPFAVEIGGENDGGVPPHRHRLAEITDFPKNGAVGQVLVVTAEGLAWGTLTEGGIVPTVTWETLQGKPESFTPAAHRHDAAEIDNLPDPPKRVFLTQAQYDALAVKDATTLYMIPE